MVEHTYVPYADKETATHEVCRGLSAELLRLSIEKIPVLLLVSGGSALKLLDSIDPAGITPTVTISVLDERFSTEASENNFSQLTQTTLYQVAVNAGCAFIDTRVLPGETQTHLRDRFETSLRQWKQANPSGVILISQGEGLDGHTSGVLPFPEDPELFEKLFLDPDLWVIDYDASGKNPYPLRVSTTLAFLRLVNISFLFVCGDEKKEALNKALSVEGSLAETPARIIQEMQDVRIFTDIK